MGLQGTLNDVSSDSIPLLLLSLVAATLSALRSSVLRLLPNSSTSSAAGNLPGLVLLSEQLAANKALSYAASGDGDRCAVCRSRMKDGDHVRELPCRHVFHRDCLRGWLLNCLTCPLCRLHLVSPHRADLTRRRLSRDLLRWFSSSPSF